jgi:hypothetical protein
MGHSVGFIPLWWKSSSILTLIFHFIGRQSGKHIAKKKLRTCPTNFQRSSRKRGTCMKSDNVSSEFGFFCGIRSLDLRWMQNLILHGIVRVSSGSPQDNMGFRVKILFFSPVLLVCLAKIFSSTYVRHLITFFESRIKFCIEWSEFQTDHLGKILWVWAKILCSSPSSAGISRRNFLLRSVFTIWLVFLDAELNSARNGPSFQGITTQKYGDLDQNTVFLALFY